MKKTILVTGLHGFIGSRFAYLVSNEFQLVDFSRNGKKIHSTKIFKIINGDLLNKESIMRVLDREKIDIVLHLAAKTHIDICEKDKKLGKQGDAWLLNVQATINLIEACRIKNIYIFYLSTECVFDGKRGNYREYDEPNPINWYGETKRQAEKYIMSSGLNYCILRSVLAYGHPKKHKYDIVQSFYDKFQKKNTIKAVIDQNISFTFLDDLINTINVLLEKKATGIYHYCGDKTVTPYKLAQSVQVYFNFKEAKVIPISMEKYFKDSQRLRLLNASLCCNKIIKNFKLIQPNIEKSFLSIKNRVNYWEK